MPIDALRRVTSQISLKPPKKPHPVNVDFPDPIREKAVKRQLKAARFLQNRCFAHKTRKMALVLWGSSKPVKKSVCCECRKPFCRAEKMMLFPSTDRGQKMAAFVCNQSSSYLVGGEAAPVHHFRLWMLALGHVFRKVIPPTF